ncbi:MAG: tetratricopeptide repeat protein [Phycisphaerae bacterium]|jgi:serine/threonine protein kinase/tetratricopeptide (TPR) repeat protein
MSSAPNLKHCPTAVELESYAAGAPASDAIRAHVQGCAACREVSQRLQANNALLDQFVRLTRGSRRNHADAPMPESVAGYRILGELHRGGQGVVFRALHAATRREVALKLPLRGSIASARQRLRFEREIELVAGLRHPNIVTLFDGGTAPDGRLYFAMELVEGVPLDRHLRSLRGGAAPGAETVREILRLFARICDAVAHAHQRGIIHRDLKPANILVDARGEPHVLDFGVAKVLENGAPVERATRTAEFVGTFAYAAPEQVRKSADDVDTRTDVYALGMILYEALCGRAPYSVAGGFAEAIEAITSAEPPAPSSINPALHDELDTIVLTALAKERERRYQSVDALRRDIEHHLAGEPIDARRDSRWYLLRKFVQRHRLLVCGAAGLVMLLAAFGATMTYLYGKAVSAEQLAEQRRKQAEEAADVSGQVIDFVREMITSIRPEVALGRDTGLLRGVLDGMVEALRHRSDMKPAVEAAVREILADTYIEIGMPAEAERQARRAVELFEQLNEPGHPQTAAAKLSLATALHKQGRVEGVEQAFREGLAVVQRELGPGSPPALNAQNALAFVLNEQGRYDEAESIWQDALRAAEAGGAETASPQADVLNNLGLLRSDRGKFAEAENYFRAALQRYRDLYGERHPLTAKTLGNLAGTLANLGQYGAAEPMFRETLALQRALISGPNGDVATTLSNLAALAQERGALDEAERLYRESIAMHEQLDEAETPDMGIRLNNLGSVLDERGDAAGAAAVYSRALEIFAQSLPANHYYAANTRSRLGGCLAALGRFEEAEAACLAGFRDLAEARGDADPLTQRAVQRLIALYEAWRRPDDARLWSEKLTP